MFGIYRTTLAMMVVFQHFYGWAPLGGYAVFSFFCLSGFLMTLLVCEEYRGRPGDFLLNRFLRIYPAYWAIAALTVAIIIARGLPPVLNNWRWGLPTEAWEIAANTLFIIRGDTIRLIPTAWAVTNELFFYVLIACGISLTPTRSATWLAASIILATSQIREDGFYFTLSAASLPFAIGACLYHAVRSDLGNRIVSSAGFSVASMAALALVAFLLAAGVMPNGGMPSLYTMMVALAPLMLLLYRYTPGGGLKRVDYAIGTLSYPIYLCQYTPLLILGREPPHFWINEQWFRPAIVGLTVLIAIAVAYLVDRPIQRMFRDRIRAREGRSVTRRAAGSWLDLILKKPA
jgi:peptidoglycan/LPS O-acetylase OafA/YrhL